MAFSADRVAQDLRARQGYGQLVNAIDRQMIANGPTGIGRMDGHAIQALSTGGGGAAFGAIGYGVARALPLLGVAGPAGWIAAAGIVIGGVIGFFVSKRAIKRKRTQAHAMYVSIENLTNKSFAILEAYAQAPKQAPVALINELKNKCFREKYLTRCDKYVIAFNETTLKKVAKRCPSDANIVNNLKYTILNAVAYLPADARPANLISVFEPIVSKLSAPVQNAAHYTLSKLQLDANRIEHCLRELRCIHQDSDLYTIAQESIAHLLETYPHLNHQIGR